jgi:hypothetical protein
MAEPTPTDAFARAAAALVREHDTADVLAQLADDACGVLSAGAVGIILRSDTGELEVLTATTHSVAELGMFQAQHSVGPCMDAVQSGAMVQEDGSDAIVARWPGVGSQVVAAGFGAVRAFPLRWHGSVLGALNAFLVKGPDDEAAFTALGQAFADVATLVILSSDVPSGDQVAQRVERALAARAVVEQAKGVLSHLERLDLDVAYERLRTMGSERGKTLTAIAREVLSRAIERPATQ